MNRFVTTALLLCMMGASESSCASPPDPSPDLITAESLRLSIEELKRTCGTRYPRAGDYLSRLDELDATGAGRDELVRLAREALLKGNPLLNRHPILFVSRPQYALDHHNTETLFQAGEINEAKYRNGGKLKKLDITTGETEILYDPGPQGMVRDPEVHFSGKRIIFSARNHRGDGYHIYEMDSDGGNIRQLTELPGVSDIDPLYLPNGDIVFSSTREPKFCMCNRHIMANLYRMEPDGANPHQIGNNTLFEGHSTLLPDGRILYDRWEYVDRNFGDAQGLWTVNPDGTNHAVYWGNNTKSPGGVIDARHIPGTNKVIAVLAACHDRPWGALAVINRQLGLDGPAPVERTWPEEYKRHITINGRDDHDSPLRHIRNRYEDPFPLNEHYFLASRMIDSSRSGEKTGLFLVDTFGNELLVHEESGKGMGAYDPMPLSPTPVPHRKTDLVDLDEEHGVFFVQNVYEGTHMKGVEPGEIKYLRIVESPEKRTWTRYGWNGQGEQAPAQNWHSFENKRVLGIVPVNPDGSACFELPADRFVYFQALDGRKRMVQSMRSGTMVRPGEKQSCVGCHDDRLSAPISGTGPTQANRKPPSTLPDEQPLFSYARDIQPIWDKHCVSCHDFGKEAGSRLNLSGDLMMPFNVSYTELWSKRYVSCIGGGPADIQPAKSWGARKSPLIDVLDRGHRKVKLTPQEMETIAAWIDLNGIYYPDYDTSYPDGVFGRGPLTPEEFNKLRRMAPAAFPAGHTYKGHAGYSLTRPEISPFLKSLPPEQAREALEILNTAKTRLEATPRADMPGFRPSDVRQLDQYDRMRAMEDMVGKAMRAGKKVYDRDLMQASRKQRHDT